MPLDVNSNVITSGTVKMFNDTTLITTGLSYLFDAGIGNSYPGSGTSWYEWVANSTTATLYSGPTPSNDGGGSIAFDGTNDYVEVPTRYITPPWTVQMWIKPNSTGGAIHSHWSGGPVGHAFFISGGKLAMAFYNSEWRYVYDSGISLGTGSWVNVAFSLTGNNPVNFWVNGQLSSQQTVPGGCYGFNWGSLACQWGPGVFFNGNIAQCANYSGTNIGQAGIFQNYQSTKVRFGLA